MYHGHDPRRIDDYPWRDVQRFLEHYPLIQQFMYGTSGGDES